MNIPGTVGGAVKMNANAYGGDLVARARVGRRRDAPAGTERRAPDRARLLLPALEPRPGEVVARASFAPRAAPSPRRSRPRSPTCAPRRRAAQPSGIKTFGSTFKNPDDPRAEGRSAGVLLDEAGCRGLQVGGARFSEKHANFVENPGDATTADVIALMAEGRRRVRERFGVELEPEVQLLGDVDASAAVAREPSRVSGLRGDARSPPPARLRALPPAVARGYARRLLALVRASASCSLAGYRLWLRDSSLVAVEHVTVTGPQDRGRRARARRARATARAHDHPARGPRARSSAPSSRLPGRARARGRRPTFRTG